MDLNEARKLATSKTEPNYLTFHLDWNKKLVLPFKAGIQLMEALESAEILSDGHDDRGIRPLDPTKDTELRSELFSREAYIRHKMASLLNITPDDLQRIETNRLTLEQAQAR